MVRLTAPQCRPFDPATEMWNLYFVDIVCTEAFPREEEVRMRRVLLIFMSLSLCAVSANAAIIAYEGHDAPAGNLLGVSTGFELGPWDPQNSEAGYAVATGGLSYGSLAVTGNTAVGGGGWTSAGLGLAISQTWEPDDAWTPYRKEHPVSGRSVAGAEGTTLWASMLVRSDAAGSDYAINFHDQHIAWNEGDFAGIVGLGGGMWGLSEKGGSAISSGVAKVVGETYLMVVKFDFIDALTDTVTLYVNPTPGLALPDVAGVSLNTSQDLSLLGVRFYPGNDVNQGAFDELRFGEAYVDVTPIPEPCTIALLSLGAISLYRKRN